MKLIDLLVQELPGRGGWPEGCQFVYQTIIDMGSETKFINDGEVMLVMDIDPADDATTQNPVFREQYEAALAASQQTAWNGEGLPPVGCECAARKKSPGAGWWSFKVQHVNYGCIFGFWKKSGKGAALDADEYDFMPLNPTRSEAERKRYEVIERIFN